MHLTINPRKVARFLFIFVAVLCVLGTIAMIIRHHPEMHGYAVRLLNLLDLDGNWNFPVWYASFALLLSSVLLFFIATATRQQHRPYVLQWYILSAIFLGMSIDEAIGLHGLLNYPMRRWLDVPNWLFFPWVIPALIFVAAVVLYFLPMVLSLPKPISNRIFAAGAIYVGGAVGMEVVAGYIVTYFPNVPVFFEYAAAIEETMEKFGILIFISALLKHLTSIAPTMTITLAPDRDDYAPPAPPV